MFRQKKQLDPKFWGVSVHGMLRKSKEISVARKANMSKRAVGKQPGQKASGCE